MIAFAGAQRLKAANGDKHLAFSIRPRWELSELRPPNRN
jgi:tRNA A37 threonylcarbamoyltransferase TsaD